MSGVFVGAIRSLFDALGGFLRGFLGIAAVPPPDAPDTGSRCAPDGHGPGRANAAEAVAAARAAIVERAARRPSCC